MKKIISSLFLIFLIVGEIGAQTIAEKKASLAGGGRTGGGDLSMDMQKFLLQINAELREQQAALKALYTEAEQLFAQSADEDAYRTLLSEINAVRENIVILQNSWRDMAAEAGQDEEYALFHQPDTTLGDLVIDYGSHDYVYLMTADIATLPVSVNSNIPIPRASWDEMLEMILVQNGVGIKQLNPYLRQLYLLKTDNSAIRMITNNRGDLEAFPGDTRIAFLLSPEPSETRRISFFLDKFINPQSSELEMVGRDILLIAEIDEVRELLKLYDFVAANSGDREYRVVPLQRVDAKEMGQILAAIFDQFEEEPAEGDNRDRLLDRNTKRGSKYRGSNGLKVITLAHVAQALFLIGTEEEISKAEDIIMKVEGQVGEARERVIFSYNAKHTDPVELADVLERVYNLMVETRAGIKEPVEECGSESCPGQNLSLTEVNLQREPKTQREIYSDGFYEDGRYVVNPAPVIPGSSEQGNKDPNKGRKNFIVDPKTSAIVMVVEANALPKLKELIKKLDVPKKMVYIDVLLFEKKMDRNTNYGMNLLRLGSQASQTRQSSITFNDVAQGPEHFGLLQFVMSRMKSSCSPAFDLVYNFLLNQDDIQINANPSVVAVNQTTATIVVTDEISVNTGIFQIDTVGGVTLKDSFTRAQYGTTIKVTPTIHMREENDNWCPLSDEEINYITLETDITFESFQPRPNDRPDVTIRHLTNEVRIADGQTVILGGLRRKISQDRKEQIPFLGEIPGIGKLFSMTELEDHSTDMYIMLTPKIISDPADGFERIKHLEMCRRPGDIPSFMCRLYQARECEKNKLLRGTMTILFGPEKDRCVKTPPWGCEYYGR
ncbi:MAG: type II secretion system protein GspD [Chlamydiia bacterium]|nr:type II secretion system protein GspD [Chlamydiia bacterium]